MQAVSSAIRKLLFHMLVLAIVGGLWVTASYRAMDDEKSRELASMGVVTADQVAATPELADQRLSLVILDQSERDLIDPT